MATSSISSNFVITKKASAKRFAKALSVSPATPSMISHNKPVLLSKEDALKLLKAKTK